MSIKQHSWEENGVVFTVENTLIGIDVNLRKKQGGFEYKCPICDLKNSFTKDYIKEEFTAKNLTNFVAVQNYAKMSEIYQKIVAPTEDFINHLMAEELFRFEFRDITRITPFAVVNMDFSCLHCGSKIGFAATVEAKSKHLPINWVTSNESLFSERTETERTRLDTETTDGQFFELHDADPPQYFNRLMTDGRRLLKLLEQKSLTFDGFQDLLWRIDWESDKRANESANEFLLRIQTIQKDMSEVPELIKRLESFAEKESNTLKTENVRYAFNEKLRTLAGMGTLKADLLGRLRRLLADNLFWLETQISRIVTAEMTEKAPSSSIFKLIKEKIIGPEAKLAI